MDLTNRSSSENVDETLEDDDQVAPTPRRLLDVAVEDNRKRSAEDTSISTGSSKRSSRSSKEVHQVQAHVIMQTKKESKAMKLATSRIETNNKLADGYPNKKSINSIVKEVLV